MERYHLTLKVRKKQWLLDEARKIPDLKQNVWIQHLLPTEIHISPKVSADMHWWLFSLIFNLFFQPDRISIWVRPWL